MRNVPDWKSVRMPFHSLLLHIFRGANRSRHPQGGSATAGASLWQRELGCPYSRRTACLPFCGVWCIPYLNVIDTRSRYKSRLEYYIYDVISTFCKVTPETPFRHLSLMISSTASCRCCVGGYFASRSLIQPCY
jgi:hypothetical protein